MNQIYLHGHDELYVVNLDMVMYFSADDHYTEVAYVTGLKTLLPFGLSKVEEEVQKAYKTEEREFLRLGRKYMVNLTRMIQLSISKQTLLLMDNQGNANALHLPKPVLRGLHELLTGSVRS